MPADIQGDVDIVIRRDLHGVGPCEGLPIRCDAATIARARVLLGGPGTQWLIAALLATLPLALLLLPGNRQREALWILLPHGLYVLLAVTLGVSLGSEAAVGTALFACTLTTVWLGAWFLEGGNRLLAALHLWLLPTAIWSVFLTLLSQGDVLQNSTFSGTVPSVALACALAFVIQAFWLRWRYRWWSFLLLLGVSLFLSSLAGSLLFVCTLIAQTMDFPGILLGILVGLPVAALFGAGCLMAVLSPYLALTLATPLYRERMFAIYRRPGTPPPGEFTTWEEYLKAKHGKRRSMIPHILLVGAVTTIAASYLIKTGKTYVDASPPTHRDQPRIAPGTPIDEQPIDSLIPPLPDGITSTTYPTQARPENEKSIPEAAAARALPSIE